MPDPATPRQEARRTRVLCVDDNPDMTAVTKMMIDADPTMRCVGCLDSADHLIGTVRTMTERPDVVLLDTTMPGADPIDTMRSLTAEFPEVRTIVLSGNEGAALLERAEKAGAWGYVSKGKEPEAILHAVREVAAGRRCWR